MTENYFCGFDFGTSGVRIMTINEKKDIIFTEKVSLSSPQKADNWKEALFYLLSLIPTNIAKNLRSIAIDGTSGTVILLNQNGEIVADPIWYNDDRGKEYLRQWEKIPPPNHVVLSATSSLAKVYWWYKQEIITKGCYLLHQADWIGYLLHGYLGVSDYHNALKLGYDVGNLTYPSWLKTFPFFHSFPQVKASGKVVGKIKREISARYGISPYCTIKAGTTDSIAAFLASEVNSPGDAVTSLGSTLVLKLLSHQRVDNANYGIYSHRLGNLWLVGGASNTGGNVLQHFFTPSQLQELSEKINPDIPTNLGYYPLLTKGERFPVNNPNLMGKLTPRPDDDILFLQGLLEGIANIEKKGYELLTTLGATPLHQVYTAGGGAKNYSWCLLRQKMLGVKVLQSPQTEAVYGSALLAKK